MKLKEFYYMLAMFFNKELNGYWFDKAVEYHIIEEMLPELIVIIKTEDKKFDEDWFMDIVRYGIGTRVV